MQIFPVGFLPFQSSNNQRFKNRIEKKKTGIYKPANQSRRKQFNGFRR